jgi:hypothetical protein
MTSDTFPRALSARLYYIGTSFSSTADDKTMTRQQHSDERPISVEKYGLIDHQFIDKFDKFDKFLFYRFIEIYR